ncbi:acetolactate decarboxylase [Luteolibacter sp. SL250]|uniref:acetolactate decarboxylase n=1 Tax=Luteolibacter sp. SL250 TaxID=2995170 RepID=UPI00226F35B4|nr:acetolactate decarboxylase [Luteolibacter sp. SL250]WAC18290.1 acetolactate decarboxylase [Luteolibacter sp. SL250]
MKLPLCTTLAAFSIIAAVHFTGSLKAGDTLVQVSTIDALVQGIFDGGVSFGELGKAGDFGIGTLDDLDGEMLALDGKFYQIASDGKVREIPATVETPFAAMTFFKSDKTLALGATESLEALQKRLDAEIPSENLFYAVKVTGSFPMIKVRSVPKQSPPYPTLTEAAKKQSLFTLENVRGTLVGFRCPSWVKGINVPGYHFHFLSDDRQHGGHVLDCTFTEGEAGIDTLENFRMLLPQDAAFLKADLTKHDEKALEAVEKLRK